MEQIGRLAKLHETNAVLDVGDYFHVKAASRNPHRLVAKTAKVHREYPCPTLCVEGNHDISHNNLNTLEDQPLGVLYETGVFQQLREQVFKDGNLQVRVVGVPYSPVRRLDELMSIQKQPGDTHLIALVHSLAAKSPPPSVEDFWNEPVFGYDSLISRNGPDVWAFGHWHRDQGVEEIRSRQFINVGAVSRGALVRENLERTPKVALIEVDQDGVRITQIPLQVAPAQDVFDIERKVTQERERADIEQFVMKLVADSAINPDASIEDNIRALDFGDDVRAEALRYLELADSVG